MQLQLVNVKKVDTSDRLVKNINTSDRFVCFLQNLRVKQILVGNKFTLDISIFETKVMLLPTIRT